MTKAELVSEISLQTGYDRTTITNVVEGVMVTVKKSVAEGEPVCLRGFGTFGTKKRAKKIARNITSMTTITVPEHNIPYFKPSDEFADLVR